MNKCNAISNECYRSYISYTPPLVSIAQKGRNYEGLVIPYTLH